MMAHYLGPCHPVEGGGGSQDGAYGSSLAHIYFGVNQQTEITLPPSLLNIEKKSSLKSVSFRF